MNPWPVFENGPGGGTQRSHRSAECNPPIRTVSLDFVGEFWKQPQLLPSPPFSSRHTRLIQTRIAACAQLRHTPESRKVEKHRSPEKFRGGSPAAMFSFGGPPGDLPAGKLLLRFPGPLGGGAWACSTACAHAGRGGRSFMPAHHRRCCGCRQGTIWP